MNIIHALKLSRFEKMKYRYVRGLKAHTIHQKQSFHVLACGMMTIEKLFVMSAMRTQTKHWILKTVLSSFLMTWMQDTN